MPKIKIKIFMVTGLAYGDEGKGSITDFLVREHNADTIVRFNGGPQAAHNVVTPERVSHCFSQFGSGTFVKGTKTYLSRFMLIDPIGINMENSALIEKGIVDAKERLVIDRHCVVVTPFHKIINRMLEISRGASRHGSCGKGVGQAMADWEMFGKMALLAGDLNDKTTMRQKLDFVWRLKLDLAEQLVGNQPDNKQLQEYLEKIKQLDYVEQLIEEYYTFALSNDIRIKDGQFLEKLLNGKGCVVFEGAQGALLDTEYGFYPYITQAKTTFENAEKLISQCGYSGQVKRIGVMRAYFTRHGAGPFVTEDKWLTEQIPDVHNGRNEWQGDFRIGWFDLVAVKYALKIIGGVDFIALTNFDRLQNLQGNDRIQVCRSYEQNGYAINKIVPQKMSTEDRTRVTKTLNVCNPVYLEVDTFDYVQFLEKELNTPISIVSVGPTAMDKIQKGGR